MGLLDGPLRNVSATLLGQFGQRVVLRQPGEEAYDPETGTVEPTYADYALRAVREPYRGRYAESAPEWVRRAEFTLTIPATLDALDGFRAPQAGDTVVMGADIEGDDDAPVWSGGTEYTVLHVQPVDSGDQAALYQLHVGR